MNALATRHMKRQPREIPADWHPADIKAALAKAGYTFARIAREYGYVSNAPNGVLHKSWSHMERIVSEILGVPAFKIWPSRYDRRGRPLKERPARVRTKNRSISESLTGSNV